MHEKNKIRKKTASSKYNRLYHNAKTQNCPDYLLVTFPDVVFPHYCNFQLAPLPSGCNR